MRYSLITRDSVGESEFVRTYTDGVQPGWSRLVHTGSSDAAPTTQQRDLIMADLVSTGLVGAVMVYYVTELTNKPRLSELSGGVIRHRHDPATGPALSELSLTINSVTAFDRIVNEDAADWEKAVKSAFGIAALEDILQKLFYDARDETFEDGMGSFFSTSLIHIVRDHGAAAVRALERMISATDVNVEAAEESLRQMGRMDDEKTHRYRLSLLERALESPNARIRDAASVGIEAMDDPAAIESLQRAIGSELHEQLRQNFTDVLEQLRDAG